MAFGLASNGTIVLTLSRQMIVAKVHDFKQMTWQVGWLSLRRNSYRLAAASIHPNSLGKEAFRPSTQKAVHAAQDVYATKVSGSAHSETPIVLASLLADDFRHPLDRQNTSVLRAIPGLSEIGRLLLGSVAEQVMLLENMGTSVLVGEKQLPRLHVLMQEAARVLGMAAPDLYVRQSPIPNAYTLAVGRRRPFVVIHTALVELLTPKELQAVFAHELGHLKCDHGLWLTFANLLALGAYSLPGLGSVLARSVEEQLFRWLRAAELTCDRAALLVAQDPKVWLDSCPFLVIQCNTLENANFQWFKAFLSLFQVVISVLMKLAGGSPSLAEELNVDAFLQQAHSYDEAANSSPLAWYLRNAQTRQLSHPLPVLRAREIDAWGKSREYKSILERGLREAIQQPSKLKI